MRISGLENFTDAVSDYSVTNSHLILNYKDNDQELTPTTYKITLNNLGKALSKDSKLLFYNNTNKQLLVYKKNPAEPVEGSDPPPPYENEVVGYYLDLNDKNVVASAITNIAYDTTNKKITQTTYGTTTTDVVTIAQIKSDLQLVKSDVELGNVENKSSATIRSEITSSNVTTALGYTPLNSILKGTANGVAELDANGHVPSSQLPSYVDDVLEGTLSTFPAAGETGKIYVDTATNISYRWSGSQYVKVASDLALGETSSTAYAGDKGKAAYDHATAKGSAFTSGFYKITTNAEGHVTAATAVQASDITAFLGSAATKNTPDSGDATTTEVVLGNDSRLSDARNAADVPSWAKAENPPSTFTTITIGNTTLDETQLTALLALLEE